MKFYYNITSKQLDLKQNNLQFAGAFQTGYQFKYNYKEDDPFKLESIDTKQYSNDGEAEADTIFRVNSYDFDDNGNQTLLIQNTQTDTVCLKDTMGTRVKNHLWDEENRLLAINDNGFVSNYFYDASGERTVKLSKPDLSIYVNSAQKLNSDSTLMKFVGYVSPYLVVTNGGRYTKHIYAGTQRIASKLGDIDAFGADPRRVATAGHDVDNAESIDFAEKYSKQNSSLSVRYDSLKVKTKPKENNDYVNGKSFCCSDKNLDEIEQNETNSAENAKLEDNLYFYHPDHLGSTNLITNFDGEVTQSVAYIPYGEVFVEERNGSWATPFLFNAKELDEETGLYYYGARYLNPTDCRWLSTDPMHGKYPGMSPYNYCAGNPVKLVDPDGEELGISVDGETYTYNPYIKNEYKGNNGLIGKFISTLDKINSTKMGNKLLTALHNSKSKYVITNKSTKEGTPATVPTKDGAMNKMGKYTSLLLLSHELFHSYQYEKGQGGASMFNEIESYTFSNRLVSEYNDNLPDDNIIFEFQQTDGFTQSKEDGDPIEGNFYKKACEDLIYGNTFNQNNFETALSLFKDVSKMNQFGLYNASHYKHKLPSNKNYLLKNFYQSDYTKYISKIK